MWKKLVTATFKVLSRHLPGKSEETRKNKLGTIIIPVEIRTGYRQDISEMLLLEPHFSALNEF
jgi:hypothetical protein